MSILSLSRSPATAVHHPVGHILSGAVQSWRTWKAMRAMDVLSDAGLHDIGITRGEIEYAARYGRPPRS